MLKTIGILFTVSVAGVLVLAAFKPAQAVISREMFMAASPEVIFPYINNSKKSYDWMPWADGDPGLKMNFSGPEEGLGASSNWVGKKMGVGSAEVIESIPNLSVKTRLVYTEPNEMNQIAELSLTPASGGTLVRWSVNGHNGFFMRLICVFMDMDKMVGDQFLKGLEKLKGIVEQK